VQQSLMDETCLLLQVTKVDDADWCEMGVENEPPDTLIKGHTLSLLLLLDKHLTCLDGIIVDGAVISE
jgi:hypothetical protein